jgi:hypothetical protein
MDSAAPSGAHRKHVQPFRLVSESTTRKSQAITLRVKMVKRTQVAGSTDAAANCAAMVMLLASLSLAKIIRARKTKACDVFGRRTHRCSSSFCSAEISGFCRVKSIPWFMRNNRRKRLYWDATSARTSADIN